MWSHQWSRQGSYQAKGRGHAKAAPLETKYKSEGPTNPVPSLLAPDVMPSIQELLLHVLVKIEGAYPTPIIIDAPAPTVSVGLL